MKTNFKKIFFSALLLFFIQSTFYGQLTVTSATACPNQSVILTASWPNVGSITYTITKPASTPTIQTSSQIAVNDPGPGPTQVVYTITASGAALSGPVTSSTTATLSIIVAPALTINSAALNYCYGTSASFTANPAGAPSYSLAGPAGTGPFAPFSSNIINLSNLVSPGSIGIYTVTGNVSGCVRTGTMQINVAPNSSITVTPSTTNVCQATGTVNLTATLPSVAGSYTWTRPSGVVFIGGILSVPNPVFADNGTYQVQGNFSFGGGPNTITCPASNTAVINVVQTSTVSISASPSRTLCQGATLGLAASTSITTNYSWQGPAAFTSNQANPTLFVVTSANTGVYTVTTFYYNAALTCTKTATVNISVISTVDPTLSGPSNICQDQTAALTASATGALPGGYSWTGPNGFSSTLQNPTIPSIQPAASGIYYATATFGSLSCPKTKSITINVVPVNTISVLPPAEVCQPDNAYLQASAIGATTFSWDGPNGNVGHTSNVILYHPPVTATGVYTLTMGFGGAALTCTNSATVSLVVKPLLNFTLAPPQLVCYNSDVHLTGPSGATSYSWTSSNSFAANTQNIDLISIQPGNAGTYSLEISLNGCITSASTTVDVLTPIQFGQPLFDQTICRGDTIHLEAPVIGGSGNPAIVWDPSVYLSAVTGSVTGGAPEFSTVYHVSAHDIICPDYVISEEIQITVNQPPASNLQLATNVGCSPLHLYYDAQTGPETAWVTYDFGSNNLQFQQDKFFVDLGPGTYNLNIMTTGTNGCSGSVPYPSPIVVYPTPTISIVTSPPSPSITDDIVFTASSQYSLSSFMWVFVNAGPSGETDTSLVEHPLRAYGNPGSYPVLVIGTTDMGCADTTLSLIQVREDFNVFIPNCFTPNGDGVNDVFQVKSSGLNPDKFTMDLIDRKGATLFSTKDMSTGWDGTHGGSKVQSDVYVYKISVVGLHGEGKKEYIGHFTLLR